MALRSKAPAVGARVEGDTTVVSLRPAGATECDHARSKRGAGPHTLLQRVWCIDCDTILWIPADSATTQESYSLSWADLAGRAPKPLPGEKRTPDQYWRDWLDYLGDEYCAPQDWVSCESWTKNQWRDYYHARGYTRERHVDFTTVADGRPQMRQEFRRRIEGK